MHEIYSSLDSTEVHMRRALLEGDGIATFVRNDNLSQLTNVLIGAFQSALCVVNDEDVDRARELLRSFKGVSTEVSDWICSQCKECVPGSFDTCWNCQSPKPEAQP